MADENEVEEVDGEGAEGEEGGKKKPGLIKLVLFIGLPALILILGGVAGALFFLGGGEDEAQVAEGEHGEAGEGGAHASDAEQALAEAHAEYKTTYPDPMVVSINHGTGSSNQMVIGFTFVYAEEATAQLLEARHEEIVSSYQGFLRELRTEDLVGSGAFYRLRLELLRRVNLEIAPARVDDVLIEQLVVN
ncbi:hypothetical protein GCM10011367_13260 [Marinicauda pacifica]|jgi:flagellar protein FliL|uniref:Flagellar protein FliL n=1 Tax=Marinicauda pacifica TaxID=1133559 RepID=A0A4V3RZ40_9PROT|nr:MULTISPECIES: flagellar basal body-associated FliL family protein [Marinicauda]TGY92759.1 hypothetical protein E5162_06700 [Marinicauda pacifica]GGE40135.1 hypothetical protein GCM10011367_13260 [Marinicauda pacifica]